MSNKLKCPKCTQTNSFEDHQRVYAEDFKPFTIGEFTQALRVADRLRAMGPRPRPLRFNISGWQYDTIMRAQGKSPELFGRRIYFNPDLSRNQIMVRWDLNHKANPDQQLIWTRPEEGKVEDFKLSAEALGKKHTEDFRPFTREDFKAAIGNLEPEQVEHFFVSRKQWEHWRFLKKSPLSLGKYVFAESSDQTVTDNDNEIVTCIKGNPQHRHWIRSPKDVDQQKGYKVEHSFVFVSHKQFKTTYSGIFEDRQGNRFIIPEPDPGDGWILGPGGKTECWNHFVHSAARVARTDQALYHLYRSGEEEIQEILQFSHPMGACTATEYIDLVNNEGPVRCIGYTRWVRPAQTPQKAGLEKYHGYEDRPPEPKESGLWPEGNHPRRVILEGE
jgi:hypothetical protein